MNLAVCLVKELSHVRLLQLEVPALILQWEALERSTQQTQSATLRLSPALALWVTDNSAGRIIVLCDAAAVKTGEGLHFVNLLET